MENSSRSNLFFPTITEDEWEDSPSPRFLSEETSASSSREQDSEIDEERRDSSLVRHIDIGSDDDSLWTSVVSKNMPLNTGSRTSSGNFSASPSGYATSDKEGGNHDYEFRDFGDHDDRLNLSYGSDLDKMDFDHRSNDSLAEPNSWRNRVRNAWSKIVDSHNRLHYKTLSPSENHLAHAVGRRRRGQLEGGQQRTAANT